MADKVLNIAQRLDAIRSEVHKIGKDTTIKMFANDKGYAAVTHDKVTDYLREPMIKHRVLMLPTLVSDETHPLQVKTAKGTGYQFFYSAIYDFKFVNIDNPEDFIITRCSGQAYAKDDKGAGKAISYATKTMMLKVFNMVSGENDEARDAKTEDAVIDQSEEPVTTTQIKKIADAAKPKVKSMKTDLIPLLNEQGFNVTGLGQLMQGEVDQVIKTLKELEDV